MFSRFKFLPLILALCACGSPAPGGPVPIPGCPSQDMDLGRFHPAGTASLDRWDFQPASCPTKSSARVTVDQLARFGQGVWMTGMYPAGSMVNISVKVERSPGAGSNAGVGPINVRAGWNLGSGYQLVAQDTIGPTDTGRTMRLSAAAPPSGYLIVGIYMENQGTIPLVVDLSDLKISPPPR